MQRVWTSRALGALGIGLVLSGCLSPEARCFAAATEDYRVLWREARAIEADLARGYALHRQEMPYSEAVPCFAADLPATCFSTRTHILELPVPIDREAHEARLIALEARMDELRPEAMARAAPCGYGDWSEAYLATLPVPDPQAQ